MRQIRNLSRRRVSRHPSTFLISLFMFCFTLSVLRFFLAQKAPKYQQIFTAFVKYHHLESVALHFRGLQCNSR